MTAVMPTQHQDLPDPMPPAVEGSQPNTLFPQWDGTPGEGGIQVDNLGQFPFGDPLFDSDPMLEKEGQPNAQIEGQPAPDPSEPAQPARAPSRRKSAAERISQLTARYRQTETERDALADQVANLSAQFQNSQAQIAELLRQRAPTPKPKPTEGGLFSAPAQADDAPAYAPVDARMIREIVAEAIKPLVTDVQVTREQVALRAQHDAALVDAIAEYPELAKPNSEAAEVFRQLYQTHPLRTLPDAPIHLAMLTRGILADARRQEQATAARKRQAGVQAPSPSATDEIGPTDNQVVARAADEARGRLRETADKSFQTYKALRAASQRASGY